jgi:uncharacterized membrane protein YtjA (UPF0391 family)
MFTLAIALFVIGILASMAGFGGLAATAIGVAKGLIVLKIIGILCVLAAVGFAIAHFSHGTPRLR